MSPIYISEKEAASLADRAKHLTLVKFDKPEPENVVPPDEAAKNAATVAKAYGLDNINAALVKKAASPTYS